MGHMLHARASTTHHYKKTPMPIKKLNTDQAADFLGVKSNTLEVWRTRKKGPKSSELSEKREEACDGYFALSAFFSFRRTGPSHRVSRKHGWRI